MLCTLGLPAAVTISLIGEDLVNVTETDTMLILQLEVTGYSFGAVPLQVLPITYSEFEMLRLTFGAASLSEIAGSRVLPATSARPCENFVQCHRRMSL